MSGVLWGRLLFNLQKLTDHKKNLRFSFKCTLLISTRTTTFWTPFGDVIVLAAHCLRHCFQRVKSFSSKLLIYVFVTLSLFMDPTVCLLFHKNTIPIAVTNIIQLRTVQIVGRLTSYIWKFTKQTLVYIFAKHIRIYISAIWVYIDTLLNDMPYVNSQDAGSSVTGLDSHFKGTRVRKRIMTIVIQCVSTLIRVLFKTLYVKRRWKLLELHPLNLVELVTIQGPELNQFWIIQDCLKD